MLAGIAVALGLELMRSFPEGVHPWTSDAIHRHECLLIWPS